MRSSLCSTLASKCPRLRQRRFSKKVSVLNEHFFGSVVQLDVHVFVFAQKIGFCWQEAMRRVRDHILYGIRCTFTVSYGNLRQTGIVCNLELWPKHAESWNCLLACGLVKQGRLPRGFPQDSFLFFSLLCVTGLIINWVACSSTKAAFRNL